MLGRHRGLHRASRFEHRITSSGSFLRVPPDADAAHTMNLLWNELQRSADVRAVTHVVAFGGTLPLLGAPVFAAWMARPLVTISCPNGSITLRNAAATWSFNAISLSFFGVRHQRQRRALAIPECDPYIAVSKPMTRLGILDAGTE